MFLVPNGDRLSTRFLDFQRGNGILMQEVQGPTAADRSSALESLYRVEGDLEKVIGRA